MTYNLPTTLEIPRSTVDPSSSLIARGNGTWRYHQCGADNAHFGNVDDLRFLRVANLNQMGICSCVYIAQHAASQLLYCLDCYGSSEMTLS